MPIENHSADRLDPFFSKPFPLQENVSSVLMAFADVGLDLVELMACPISPSENTKYHEHTVSETNVVNLCNTSLRAFQERQCLHLHL